MQLIKIPYAQVLPDVGRQPPLNFNTSFHSAAEAPGLDRPSESPYSFKRWLPLILRSRGLAISQLQVVAFSTPQTRLLLQTAEGSIQQGAMNRMYAEDIEEEIAPKFSGLRFPPGGLFMRLDACSPKDGVYPVPRRRSLHSVKEVILRLVTSTRARNAMVHCLERGEELELFFLPFDGRMRSEDEYRVFCPPPGDAISGISQYQWHKPWKFQSESHLNSERIVQAIVDGSQRIRESIVADSRDGDEMDEAICRQGFTFDVLFNEQKGTCELIELNVFGVRSACGSCLFQWVRDKEVLYSRDANAGQFRVAVE